MNYNVIACEKVALAIAGEYEAFSLKYETVTI